MSYTALYRKYRPLNFEDVRGQEHIVTTIKNQIRTGRIGHAYLFCGTRGTGKTTVVKIFAKAVNCEQPQDGSPCGECPACKAIAAGNSMNVIEIDAASNNGVDNIREIREEVTYAPTEGRYRVYIIDEVHMLSIGAFNALLKTLEEPPSYVIFILATTEAHKIPVTILSRCQRYDFHRISVNTIAERLQKLIELEEAQAEEKAVRYIAKSADGAMRDALSLLDQCMAFYMGQKLTYEHVLEVLGAVDTGRFSSMLRAVTGKDIAGAMRLVEQLVAEGRDLGQFVNDYTWYMRNLLLLQSSDDMEDVLDMSVENMALLKEECQMISGAQLIRDIRIFSELSSQIRYSSQKRILIEIAIIKLCRPEMEQDQETVLARLEQVEHQVSHQFRDEIASQVSLQLKQQMRQGAIQWQDTAPQQSAEPEEAVNPVLPAAVTEDIRAAVKNWPSIVSAMPGMIRTFMQRAHLSLAGDSGLLIVLDDAIGAEMLSGEEHRQEIADIISKTMGKEIQVQIRVNDTGHAFEEAFVDLKEAIHMEIEYEEEDM